MNDHGYEQTIKLLRFKRLFSGEFTEKTFDDLSGSDEVANGEDVILANDPNLPAGYRIWADVQEIAIGCITNRKIRYSRRGWRWQYLIEPMTYWAGTKRVALRTSQAYEL